MIKLINELREGFFFHGLGDYTEEYLKNKSKDSMAGLSLLFSLAISIFLFDSVLYFDPNFKLNRAASASILALVFVLIHFFYVRPNLNDEIDLDISEQEKKQKIRKSYTVLFIGLIIFFVSVYVTYLLYKR